MVLKWIKLVGLFLIFGLWFLTNFMYEWFPNTYFSIFLQVNESIWEHMKMLFSAIILYGIFEFILLKLFKEKTDNFLSGLFISGVISIPVFLIIYLPFYYLIGENMALNLIVLFITIGIIQYISYLILKTEKNFNLNIVSIIGIILVYIVFGILTYYPPINDLFYDSLNKQYGINTYDI